MMERSSSLKGHPTYNSHPRIISATVNLDKTVSLEGETYLIHVKRRYTFQYRDDKGGSIRSYAMVPLQSLFDGWFFRKVGTWSSWSPTYRSSYAGV